MTLARPDSAAPRNTGVCCGSSSAPPHRARLCARRAGAVAATPRPASACRRCTRARPFQYRHSTRLAELLDREDALVRLVERRHQLVDVGLALEAPAGQGHVELPDLVRVARLDDVVLHARVGGRRPCARRTRRSGGPGRRGPSLTSVAVERVRVGAPADGELGDDVAEQAAGGRERGRGLRHEHLVAAELLGDLRHRQPAGSAAGDHDRLARVDALVDRDLAHGADHVLVGDREDRPGGALHAEAERPGHGLARSPGAPPPRRARACRRGSRPGRCSRARPRRR